MKINNLQNHVFIKISKIFRLFIIIVCLYGCANNKQPSTNSSQSIALNNKQIESYINKDTFEIYNRGIFKVNMALDILIKPITIGYVTYIPSLIRAGIANFFNNLRDFVTLGNDILQLNSTSSIQTIERISINSTIGILGIIDLSSYFGINMHKNSFGKTMKFYGWKHSSYFIIPLLGPSTLRDFLGTIPDVIFNPTWYIINDNYISIGLFTTNAIDTRARYLGSDKIFYSSLDPYITMRDIYLQTINEPITNNDDDVNIDSILNESQSN